TAATDRVLGAWLAAAVDCPLTTAAALTVLRQHAGEDVAAYLRDALTTAGWQPGAWPDGPRKPASEASSTAAS
ncbi:MAG: hypothetical protein KJ041_08865, partial [Gammaproteobacteria bacterium]|nr:hypothetical protein [Gammaproteobacteria bacterium]